MTHSPAVEGGRPTSISPVVVVQEVSSAPRGLAVTFTVLTPLPPVAVKNQSSTVL